ncbi:hypothetical protein CLV35_0218 [Motilibacter peucedani]|uniref:Uncharacterized protein n=1 Tax=Motilibacter peucedani TaxID=598650 RepID=A0A420XVE7_9ACTN|nr:hypothetical protein [Motilibacter peucedani]RKS80629.1 hypothetical protein CLV35_0218 [Motilibacter peucedani]
MSVPTHEQHEDPIAHASNKVVQWVSVATMAAEALAQIAASRERLRAAADERAAGVARAEMAARQAQATATWAPLLDPRTRETVTLQETGHIWATAQGWRPQPEAERVSGLAEDRLRTLRPDVMERYDRLRADGATPVDAMRRVAPYFDQPATRVWEGQPGQRRGALNETAGGVETAAAVAIVAAVDAAEQTRPGSAGGGPAVLAAPAGATASVPTLAEVAGQSNVLQYLQLKDYGLPPRDALHAAVGSALSWEAYAGYADARQRGVPAAAAAEQTAAVLGATGRIDAHRPDLPEVYSRALAAATGSDTNRREEAIEATVEHFLTHPTSPQERVEGFPELYDRAAERARAGADLLVTPLEPATPEDYRQVENRLRGQVRDLLTEQPAPQRAAAGQLAAGVDQVPTQQQGAAAQLQDLAAARGRDAAVHTAAAITDETTVDNPATVRVDEHRQGVARAVPERVAAAVDGGQARAARADGATAAELSALAYPEPMNAAGAAAARAGITGAPSPVLEQGAAAATRTASAPATAAAPVTAPQQRKGPRR